MVGKTKISWGCGGVILVASCVPLRDDSATRPSGHSGFTIEATLPPLVVVGDPTELVAAAPAGSNRTTFSWEVVRGRAAFDDPHATAAKLIAENSESLLVRLAVTADFPGSEPVTATREYEIVSVADLRPRVLIETNLGDMTLELNGEAAPRHTANLLLYVDEGFYDDLLFHRAVCDPPGQLDCVPFVIQAGGYRREGSEVEKVPPTRDPVASESGNGLSNAVVYTIALALSGGDPDSGTTQFFVNLNPNNVSLDNQGFTVFGTVIAGTDVADAIARVETELSPVLPDETSLPVEDIVIQQMTRLTGNE